MWLIHLMAQTNYEAMKAKGVELSAEEIYSETVPSLKGEGPNPFARKHGPAPLCFAPMRAWDSGIFALLAACKETSLRFLIHHRNREIRIG